MRLVALLAVVLIGACARGGADASDHSSATPSRTVSAAPATVAAAPTPAQTASAPRTTTSPSPPPPAPAVHCIAGVIPAYQAVVAGADAYFLYDVTDPLRPHAVCRIANTVVHIVTGTSFEYLVPHADGTTDVVLHSLGSNNESVAATLMADLYHAETGFWSPVAWSSTAGEIAYLALGGVDANGLGVTDVWLATSSGRTKIYSYAVPGKDSFGRPGFPPPMLAFSADGAYLLEGWTVAVTAPRVVRLSDMANVTPALPADFRFGIWAKTGEKLYLVTGSGVAQWAPGSAVTALPRTTAWILGPNFSPDGTQVAFTAVTASRDVRSYVYDLASQSSRLLVDGPRSSAAFVRASWVWYLEEKPCVQASNTACFDPTAPDGKVLAFDTATGTESGVTFASGEAPLLNSFANLGAGELWPNS